MSTHKIRVFVSYDREHDGDLRERLAEQAARPTSAFEIVGYSRDRSAKDLDDEALRRAIRGTDQVIVLCGEHSGESGRMGAELRIAQEEQRPYLLLWGRRDPMCRKPATAKPTDCMYTWTVDVLQQQVIHLRRTAEAEARDAERREAKAAAARES